VTLRFALSWHFPNRQREESVKGSNRWDKILPAVLGNDYAQWLADATAAAQYVAANCKALLGSTRLYVDTMYSSSLPWELVDSAAGPTRDSSRPFPSLPFPSSHEDHHLPCVSGRAAVLRSPTMWRTAAGVVMGSEGNGCCPLNCSHVYGCTHPRPRRPSPQRALMWQGLPHK